MEEIASVNPRILEAFASDYVHGFGQSHYTFVDLLNDAAISRWQKGKLRVDFTNLDEAYRMFVEDPEVEKYGIYKK